MTQEQQRSVGRGLVMAMRHRRSAISIRGRGPLATMGTQDTTRFDSRNEMAAILVADARETAWRQMLTQAGCSLVISTTNVGDLPELAAGRRCSLVCIDASIADRNSLLYLQETVTRMKLDGAAVVVLADENIDAARYRALSFVTEVVTNTPADSLHSIGRLREHAMRPTAPAPHQLLATALAGSSTGLLVVDIGSRALPIVYVNPECSRLTGYEPSETPHLNWGFLDGAETDRETAAKFLEALRSGRECAVELLQYRKDGTTFWSALSARTAHDAESAGYAVVTQSDVTERRRIRERLRASEARLELAMSASGLAMWDWNVATGEIYYNDQWQVLLEAPTEELLTRESLAGRLVLPESDASIFADLERHLSGEAPRFEREFELRTASGRPKAVAARADVINRDAAGQPLRVIGVWRDMTARKDSLRTIEETHKRWERAVAGTSDGLFDWDLATGYVWYAPRFREQLGYTDHELNNSFTAFQRILHDEERLAVLSKIRAHLEQRVQLDLNCRVCCKSGEYRWFRLRGNAERDAAGRPRRLSGSIRDISGQVDAEQALHRSQDFYGAILDALPITVAYIDNEQKIVYANKASGELMDMDADRLCGVDMHSVLQSELLAQLTPPLTLAFRDKRPIERQIRAQDRGGQAMDIDIMFLPHCDAQGEVEGCFVVARNVTARMRLEAELRQSQKMEAIGRLTGGVAHDFNNLLSVAIGNAQLLSRTLKDSPRLHKQAETILRAAMRGAELTRRLLTFARQQQSVMQVAKVNDLIAGMFELLRRTLPGDIDLQMQLDDVPSFARFDAGQFENALLNLIINARDAMPRGGSINVRSALTALSERNPDIAENVAPGNYVEVCVSDTGTGMQPETLRRIFEPFFTTKESGKGSGLGLPMVQTFVKGCSGYIAVRSTPGAGTQIRLYLPREQAPHAEQSERATIPSELPRGVETVLVVDDNADVRTTATEMLSSLGYRVLSAGSTRAAFELAAGEGRVDLLFSDVMLSGGVSSHALIRKLREQFPHIKPLLTSGFSDSMLMHRSLLDGSVEILSKPYELSDLARRVRAVLDSEQEKVRVTA